MNIIVELSDGGTEVFRGKQFYHVVCGDTLCIREIVKLPWYSGSYTYRKKDFAPGTWKSAEVVRDAAEPR